MPRLLLAFAFAVVVTAVACGGRGDSTSDDDLVSYQLAFLEVQEAVGGAGFGVARGLADFEICVTDDECADAMLLVADEYVPYVAVLEEQLGVLNGLDPPASFRSLHDNYTEQTSLRREAGELWIDGTATLDIEKLTLSRNKFSEAQLLTSDILDDLQELFGEAGGDGGRDNGGGAGVPPQGFVSYSSPSRGYSIFVPSDWLPMPDFVVEFEGEPYAKLDVFEGAPENGFRTNLSVTDDQIGKLTPDQVYEAALAQSEERNKDLVVEDIVIDSHSAKLLHFTVGELTSRDAFDQSQVLLVIDTRLWRITLSTAPGQRDKYLPTFETMWRSFAPVAEP